MAMSTALLRKYRHRVAVVYFLAGSVFGSCISFFINSAATSVQEYSNLIVSTSSMLRPRDQEHSNDDGWKLIHVFYGNDRHLPQVSTISTSYFTEKQPKWFSQLRQDEVVSRLLHNKRNGFFVDLAANDALKISNTYALEHNFGWDGLCLEPNPIYWSSLSYRKCQVAGVVVGPEPMREIYFKFPNRQPAQGGIVGKDFDNKEKSHFHEDQPRYTNTLSQVFQRFSVPSVIDYLSLDVEGAEDFIMESFPFYKYQINVLTVERPSDALQSILKQNGYVLLKQLKKWGETLWIHQSIATLVDRSALDIDTENYKYREK